MAKAWADALTRWAGLRAERERRLDVTAVAPSKAQEMAARWAWIVAGSDRLDRADEGWSIVNDSALDDPLEPSSRRSAGPDPETRLWRCQKCSAAWVHAHPHFVAAPGYQAHWEAASPGAALSQADLGPIWSPALMSRLRSAVQREAPTRSRLTSMSARGAAGSLSKERNGSSFGASTKAAPIARTKPLQSFL